jgi:hypothetical protein
VGKGPWIKDDETDSFLTSQVDACDEFVLGVALIAIQMMA